MECYEGLYHVWLIAYKKSNESNSPPPVTDVQIYNNIPVISDTDFESICIGSGVVLVDNVNIELHGNVNEDGVINEEYQPTSGK